VYICGLFGAACRLDFALPHGSYEGSMLFDLAAGMGYFFDSEAAVANVRQPLCQPIALTPKITQLLSWDCTHTTLHLPPLPSSSTPSLLFVASSPALLARFSSISSDYQLANMCGASCWEYA
jgi:hypothetical protein